MRQRGSKDYAERGRKGKQYQTQKNGLDFNRMFYWCLEAWIFGIIFIIILLHFKKVQNSPENWCGNCFPGRHLGGLGAGRGTISGEGASKRWGGNNGEGIIKTEFERVRGIGYKFAKKVSSRES